MYLHFQKVFFLCQPTYFNVPLSIMLLKLLFCSKLFKGSLFLNNKIQHLKILFIICILLILFFLPPTYYFSHSPHFSFFSTLFFITAFLLRIPPSPLSSIFQSHFNFFFFWNLIQPYNPLFQTLGSSEFLNSEFWGVYTENICTYHLLHNIPSGAWSVFWDQTHLFLCNKT